MQHYRVNVEWAVEKRIILIQPIGDFEAEIALAAVEQVKQMVNEGCRPVHLMIDASRVTTHLRDPKVFGNSLDSLRHHRNIGRLVFVYANPFVRFAGELLARFLGIPFRVAATYEYALTMLHKIDPTLADHESHSKSA